MRNIASIELIFMTQFSNAMPDEFFELLLKLELDEISDSEMQRLREWLATDDAAAEVFVEWRLDQAALHLENTPNIEGNFVLSSNLTSNPDLQQLPRGNQRIRRNAGRRFLALVATIALACLGMRWAYLETQSGLSGSDSVEGDSWASGLPITEVDSEAKEPTYRGVALLTRAVDVKWREGEKTRRYEVGQAIEEGSIAIDSGFLQIEFFGGAMLIVEGPAELGAAFQSSRSMSTGQIASTSASRRTRI